MAYDICLSKTRRDASRTNPILSLDVQQHAVLFCQKKELIAGFTNISGMSNYYGDVVYLGEEILDLRDELVKLDKILHSDKGAHSIIVKILELVEIAISEKMGIYCFCA